MKKALSLLFISALFPSSSILSSTVIDLDKFDSLERKSRLQAIYVPQEVHDNIFQQTKDIVDVFDDHNIPVMAGYKTVLDLIRYQATINHQNVSGIKKHDDAVDLIIDLRDKEKILSCQSIFDALGYRFVEDKRFSCLILESKKPAIFSYRGSSFSHTTFVNFFIFKTEKDHYILAEQEEKMPEFLKRGWFTKEEFENRKLFQFGPIKLNAPLNANNYLKRLYGEDCLTKAYFSSIYLKPGETVRYQWTLSAEEIIPALPSKPLGDHYIDYKKQKYWDTFYKEKWITEPSSFALLALPFMKPGESVVEIGCGNGRDAFFFARNRLMVKGIDSSEIAILKNNEIAQTLHGSGLFATFKSINVIYSQNHLHDFIHDVNHLYARFFLHDLTPNDQNTFLTFIEGMHTGLKIYFEFRTDKDPLLKKSQSFGINEGYAYDHYRCFINLEKLVERLKKSFQLHFVDERDGLSIIQKEDGFVDNPVLARIIGEKK